MLGEAEDRFPVVLLAEDFLLPQNPGQSTTAAWEFILESWPSRAVKGKGLGVEELDRK